MRRRIVLRLNHPQWVQYFPPGRPLIRLFELMTQLVCGAVPLDQNTTIADPVTLNRPEAMSTNLLCARLFSVFPG